ncbi:hypothetical protein CcI156_05290 [Frankia sp. CcI156]|jgi:hypothetical protein|uniref:protealysin inhibitor emfourin n=1 Tax=Frankia TaxID=1854 RepID=UPI0003CFCE52|nr:MULTISPECIES: protealysin inhibitor emfourin [Frankia]ETA02443.1 hypothetical protein CcI6DRAFT_02034 [Frankia sp. CcI6]EYT90482.1 hypothetical protein ThrDRAFT_03887 [Frankia casuarinae]KDA43102.1 hypothetical protein BMG523Draft_01975 [Frankia sp. BMG5.23]KEZ35992.1 hypothetical protein CEDDRAFT_02595 [Frankia sp. CeD]OAA29691.1 hypothetical protein AAY23_101411 [Frankia casuarinae]
MARTAERVRVVLERSGGLLGRSVRRGLDTVDLSEQEAENLRRLAREAVHRGGLVATTDAADAGQVDSIEARGSTEAREQRDVGADRFVYTLEIDRAGEHAVRTFSEPVPDEVRPLLALLRTAPLLPASRP